MNRLPILALLSAASPVAAQAPACTTARDAAADPHELLERAARAMGVDDAIAGGRALHCQFIQADAQPYRSDRYYPPFFDAMSLGSGPDRSSLLRVDPGG